MEPIRSRTLEMTVISGENLCVDGTPVTKNANVVVRPESIRCWSTKMAKGSRGQVSWKEKLLVEMPMHAKCITLEVQSKSSKGTVKSVGIARIGISELVGEEGEALSYGLRNWEGRRSGVINFSVRRVKHESESEEEDKPMMPNSSGGFNFMPEAMGVQMNHHHQINANKNNGVVIGIPVWWNHINVHASRYNFVVIFVFFVCFMCVYWIKEFF